MRNSKETIQQIANNSRKHILHLPGARIILGLGILWIIFAIYVYFYP